MNAARRPLLALCVAALLVHGALLAAAAWRYGGIDALAFRSVDATEYVAIARNLASAASFSQSSEPPLVPDTWRTPGYPLFLAGCMVLGVSSPAGLVLVQQGLAIAAVLVFYRIASATLGTRRGMAAALLLLLEPYHLYYSLWLLSTTLFLFMLLILWACWRKARASKYPLWWSLSGAAAGALVLVWPVAIAVPGVLLLAALVRAVRPAAAADLPAQAAEQPGTPHRQHSHLLHPGGRKQRLAGALLFASVCAAVIGSWALRNRIVAGHWALSHQSGIVLAYFKATEVVLWREGRGAARYDETSLSPQRPHTVWPRIDAALRQRLAGLISLPAAELDDLRWPNLAQGNRTSIDAFEISAALRRIGLDMLSESPLHTTAFYIGRAAGILTFPLHLALWPVQRDAEAETEVEVEVEAEAEAEAPSAGNGSTRNGFTSGRIIHGLLGAAYTAVLLAAIAGLWRSRGRTGRADAVFTILVCAALLAASTPQLDPRFRVAMMPLLFVWVLQNPVPKIRVRR